MPKANVSQHHSGEWIAEVILKQGGVGVGFFEIADTKLEALVLLKKRIKDLHLPEKKFNSIKWPIEQ